MSKRRMQSGNEGFTLIEVILSIAILAFISVPLMKYFAESLSYARKTAERQGATLIAQETIEYIKAQKRVVVWQGAKSTDDLVKMHFDITDELKNKFHVDLDRSFETVEGEQGDFSFDTGSGKLQYSYTTDQASGGNAYDIEIELDTKIDAAADDKPLMYGIDDVSNVISSEYEEQDNALLYFVSLNKTAYDIGHSDEYDVIGGGESGGGGGHSGLVGGDDDETGDDPALDPGKDPKEQFKDVEKLYETPKVILQNMERTIHVEMQENKQDVLGGTYISVRVYYVYSCKGITGDEPEEYETSDLINTNVEKLEGVYLMFSKMNSNKDKVIIEWLSDAEHPAVPSQAEYPAIWLVCQNMKSINPYPDEMELAEKANTLFVEMKGVTLWPTDATTKKYIYTNVENEGGVIEYSDDGSNDCVIKGLTSATSPVRIFDVTVTVYPKGQGGVAGKELIQMKTTKVE